MAAFRADLRFEPTELTLVRSASGDGVRIRGNLTNRGHAPAMDVEIGGVLTTYQPEIGLNVERDMSPSLVSSQLASLGQLHNVSLTIPFERFVRADQTDARLWCVLCIRWRNLLGDVHSTSIHGHFVDRNDTPLSKRSLAVVADRDQIFMAVSPMSPGNAH